MTKREEREEMWLRSKGFNIEFKSSKRFKGLALMGSKRRRKKKQQQKSTPIDDFKLGRYTIANFKSGVHEAS